MLLVKLFPFSVVCQCSFFSYCEINFCGFYDCLEPGIFLVAGKSGREVERICECNVVPFLPAEWM